MQYYNVSIESNNQPSCVSRRARRDAFARATRLNASTLLRKLIIGVELYLEMLGEKCRRSGVVRLMSSRYADRLQTSARIIISRRIKAEKP